MFTGSKICYINTSAADKACKAGNKKFLQSLEKLCYNLNMFKQATKGNTMNTKQVNRKIARTAGGSVSSATKSSAYEIRGHYCAEWRREWIRRGLDLFALRGPLGKLP